MLDSNLVFRAAAAGNLTTDETNVTILDLGRGGTPAHGLTVTVRIPTTAAASTLDITVNCDNDSALGSADLTATFPQISAAGLYTLRFHSKGRRYVGLTFNNSATTSWGAVQAWLSDEPVLRGSEKP